MTTEFYAVQNEDVMPRPMNVDVQRRLNLYGDYNLTFWERYCPEKNQNRRPASAPQFEGYKFDILGSNPLNGAVAHDPSVVQHELDQVLNRDADTSFCHPFRPSGQVEFGHPSSKSIPRSAFTFRPPAPYSIGIALPL